MKINNNLKSSKKFDIEDLLNFLAERLSIPENVELSLFYNDKLLKNLSTEDVKFEALIQNPVPHKYVLFVREDVWGLQYIICHELIHLSQMERGDLIISSDYREVIWKGEKYTNDLLYADREWEKEAFMLDNKLWKEYKNEDWNR